MKQKRTKGFTLIELLAVIVILAIIALIAVPVIMNIINKANKSAFKDTAYGIISAGELYFAERQLEINGMQDDVTITLPDSTKTLELKGDVPQGEILITKEGKISLVVKNNRYCITKGLDDKDITVTEDVENCELPGYVEETIIITFTIEGTEYQAEKGMTWAKFIESEYNDGSISIVNGTSVTHDGSIIDVEDGGFDTVTTDEIITAGHNYVHSLWG